MQSQREAAAPAPVKKQPPQPTAAAAAAGAAGGPSRSKELVSHSWFLVAAAATLGALVMMVLAEAGDSTWLWCGVGDAYVMHIHSHTTRKRHQLNTTTTEWLVASVPDPQYRQSLHVGLYGGVQVGLS